jgi:hypothetical protein
MFFGCKFLGYNYFGHGVNLLGLRVELERLAIHGPESAAVRAAAGDRRNYRSKVRRGKQGLEK